MPQLYKYFEHGKVLIIGLTLAENDEWNCLLTSELCGDNETRFKANDTQLIGGVRVTHRGDVRMLLSDEMLDELASFDIIVIGLEPDRNKAERQFRLLTERLKSVYAKSEAKAVSSPLPQVLAFPTIKGSVLCS